MQFAHFQTKHFFNGKTESKLTQHSIGGLLKSVSTEDIELGVSVLRNEHLANIIYRLKLIEAYGTGITNIRRSYAGAAIQPEIEVTNNAFKITLPNLNCISADTFVTTSDTSGDCKTIAKIPKKNGKIPYSHFAGRTVRYRVKRFRKHCRFPSPRRFFC